MQRRWLVEEQIGRGGMGVVFRARDPATGERAALKRMALLASHDHDLLGRFEREARAAQAIQHRNVVRLLDWGEDHGAPCLVFELVEGGSLADRVHREGPLPWREAAALAAGVARGLEAVHAAGLVHRDVKPGNILLGKDGAKLSDLGLVKRQHALEESRALTSTGEVVGTPHYVSPEQVQGEPVTPLTDLYALGGTLYFALTGVPPFEGSALAVMTKHLEERPVPPSRLRSGLPRDLERLVLALLEKKPAARGASAGEVARALDALAVERRRSRGLVVAGLTLAGVAGGLALLLRPREPVAAPVAPPEHTTSPPVSPPGRAAPPSVRFSARLDELESGLAELRALPPPERAALVNRLIPIATEASNHLEKDDLPAELRERALPRLGTFTEWLLRPDGSPEECDAAERFSLVILRVDRDHPQRRLVLRSSVLFKRQRYAGVLEIHDEIETLGVFAPKMHANRALALAGLGKRDEALAALARVPTSGPGISETWRQAMASEIDRVSRAVELRTQARALFGEMKDPEALAAIDEALARNPEDGDSYNVRAGIRERLGDHEGAREDNRRCYLSRSPAAASAIAWLGRAEKDRTAALPCFTRSIELDPEYELAYQNRARARMELGVDLDGALADVDRALELGAKHGRPPEWSRALDAMRAQIEERLTGR